MVVSVQYILSGKTEQSAVDGLNKVKNKKYHTVRTIPKSNIKIVERSKIDTTNTQIHDLSLSWFGTGS